MAIKKLEKNKDSIKTGGGISPSEDPVVSVYGLEEIPDFDFEEKPNSGKKSKDTSTYPMSMQGAFLADAGNHPCYGNLVNPPPPEAHWHAQQVQAELKVVLRGFSRFNSRWREDVADRFIKYPCGLEETGFTLSWVCPEDDWDSRMLMQDIREHMKWAFGDYFIVRPVSELSQDAKGWKFQLGNQ